MAMSGPYGGYRRSFCGAVRAQYWCRGGAWELRPRARHGAVLGRVLGAVQYLFGAQDRLSLHMSTTAFLAFAFSMPLARLLRLPAWGMRESNIKQARVTGAVAIVSGGLTKTHSSARRADREDLSSGMPTAWVFSVSVLGVASVWFRGRLRLSRRLRRASRVPRGSAPRRARPCSPCRPL